MKQEDVVKKFPILKYFTYAHLPSHLQPMSRLFHQVAFDIVQEFVSTDELDMVNNNAAEVAAGFRKLLEAKDCFVRSKLN